MLFQFSSPKNVMAAPSKSKEDPIVVEGPVPRGQPIGNNRSRDMDLWPLLNLVPNDIRMKISRVYTFGQFGTELLFTTLDDKVCTYKSVFNHLK